MKTKVLRLVVLISGGGSNLQAIMDAIQSGTLSAQIVAVFSNRKDAYGLERARQAGIPAVHFPLKPFKDDGKSRMEYDAALAETVRPYQPDLIVLAGWMHILSSAFLDQFPQQVINLHPALPGEFPGINAIEKAFEAAAHGEITRSGIMIHYAIPEVDAGAVIVSEEVPIQPDDTLEVFTTRMHQTEHRLIVQAIDRISRQNQ